MKKSSFIFISALVLAGCSKLSTTDVETNTARLVKSNISSQNNQSDLFDKPAPDPIIPPSLKVSVEDKLVAIVPASGVQIYNCLQTSPAKFEWVFKAPEADLYDKNGNYFGKHYVGPTWESLDGSKVIGKVIARADSHDPASIPWLLLNAVSTEGTGIFSKVTKIQRLKTKGGQPNTLCDASKEKQELRVNYTAVYYFYSLY